jgi:hypothetical protein
VGKAALLAFVAAEGSKVVSVVELNSLGKLYNCFMCFNLYLVRQCLC